MCRGLAILYNKKGKVICKGLTSHSETAGNTGEEDGSLKYEIIINDSKKEGYTIEIDHQYERGNKDFGEAKLCLKEIKKWVKENEKEVLRYLLTCQNYAVRKGNTDNDHQETKGDTDNSHQETKGTTYNSCQKTKGTTYNSYQETGKEWYLGLIELKEYPKTTELIKTVKDDWRLTIVDLCSWIAFNPKRALKILGKEAKYK